MSHQKSTLQLGFIGAMSLAMAVFPLCMAFAQSQTADDSLEYIWRQNLNELRLYVNELLEENQGLKKRITELETAKPAPVEPKPLKAPENTALKKEVETLKQQKRGLEEELQAIERQKGEWDKEHATHRKKTADETRRLEKLLKECQTKSENEYQKLLKQEKEIADLKSKLAVSVDERSLTKLRQENEVLRVDLNRLKNELSDSHKESEELKAQNAKQEMEIAGLLDDKSRLIKQQEISESLLKLQPSPPAPQPSSVAQPAPPPDYELSAYNLARAGSYAEAIAEYKKALAERGPNKNIYFNLGLLYEKLKLYPDAADNFQKVVEIDPADKDSLLNLSRIYDKLADPAKARYYYDQAKGVR